MGDRDQRARRRITESLEESLLVEAAAGTGKTTQLVGRLVNLLRLGLAEVHRVVAVTFTRKAAGEMKLRLRQRLDEARAAAGDAAERQRLEQAIAHLEEAHIGTIHSFCAEILRERPVEAGVDPGFQEIDEEEAGELYARAFRRWVERRLEEMPEALRRALARLSVKPTAGEDPLDRLRREGQNLLEWRDFPAPWRRERFDREPRIDDLVTRVHRLAGYRRRAEPSRDPLWRALESVELLSDWVERGEAAGAARDYDALEARLIVELPRDLRDRRKGRGEWFAEGVAREQVLAERQDLSERLEEFQRFADADLASALKAELDEVTADYERLKRTTGRLDFLDLLLSARDLVRDDAGVRRHLQERFTHLLVDEFQDTDPLQAELLLLLAADDPDQGDWRKARPAPGKLFLVGDPKQSIYRFRRADVVLYQEIKRRLETMGVGVVYLTRSWRAVRPIQQAVNAAFAEPFTEDEESGQAGYVPLEPHREAPPEQPSVVVLPVPRPYSPWGRLTNWALEESLPEAAAGFLAWLLEESGWTVEETPGGRVPIAPHHVCLQFRRFLAFGRDVTREWTRALETRGVPHLLIGGRSLHQQEEVETLRTALTAIEWPDDELSVFATLKGSLFALGDDLLLRFRTEVGSLHPFRPAPKEGPGPFAPVYEALALLAELSRRRNRVPVAATVQQLLRATRAHAGFAVRPAGHQVLANVQRLIDLARNFERRGGISFRGFVEGLIEEGERTASRATSALEEGAEGVRLMTVHSAKGLEFPVVLLADPTCRLAAQSPAGTVDTRTGLAARQILRWSPWELLRAADRESARDRAEGVRVAYVAATRARDLLIVPAVGDEPRSGGWFDLLKPAIYPQKDAWRQAEAAPGCPPFGAASVLERPQRLDREGEISVRPGLHRPESGDHSVVWWDPALLEPREGRRRGVARAEILAEDEGREAAEAGLERYRRWRRQIDEVGERGSRPSLTTRRVTELDRSPPGAEPEMAIQALPRPPERPAGRRFGTLVHTVLRDAALGASADAIQELAEFHRRALQATEEEGEACGAAVSAALAHPVVRQAAAAAECHREAPFLLHTEQGEVVEGVFDLIFRDDHGWMVVDFKTDLQPDADGGPPAEPAPAYRRQLAWYVAALSRLTGEPARGLLLGI